MFLNRKIQASGIAEVVIAISVIALCIGIASLVFVRSTKSTVNFQQVRKQTEIQSQLWEKLYSQENEVEAPEDLQLEIQSTSNDSIDVLIFKASDGKVVLKQDWWHE
ncbi:MAG: hypothetical protein HRT58_22100 [Crocinitomicaceae bacterium]|nr:hypothetical protein [Flavobacteriales bacterium]NQZ38369.1 hypothetical protein [Crocinitomicaceae bacterium]PHR26320.1 MAG: hypothetical protein COA38_15155 [Fluviicola sp.]